MNGCLTSPPKNNLSIPKLCIVNCVSLCQNNSLASVGRLIAETNLDENNHKEKKCENYEKMNFLMKRTWALAEILINDIWNAS